MDRLDRNNLRELTDEEWCELCFMLVEMDEVRQRMTQSIIADERPSLDELWFAMSNYQRETDKVFAYVAERLRAKARQAA